MLLPPALPVQRKKRTHVPEADAPKAGEPRSFVIRRGKYAPMLKDLEKDLRQMMMPNTAKELKVCCCVHSGVDCGGDCDGHA